MKRILALLCVIACLCGLCVPAMAANEYVIHVDVPDEWATAYVWAWDANQKNAFDAWPGLQLTKGADGYYTGNVPSGYTNLVIAEKDGGAQTIDINNVEPKELWIVLGNKNGEGKHEYSIGYSKDSVAPPASNPGGNGGDSGNVGGAAIDVSALNSMALVGTGIPGVGEWNPGDAAGDMTKVSDGVYSKVIAVTAGTAMQFKMAANDTWDGGANLGAAEEGVVVTLGQKIDLINDGGSKDLSLSATKDCNLKFTVTIADGAASLLVEETDEEPTTNPGGSSTVTPGGPTVTVYAKVPADWSDVRVWAWNDSQQNASPTWPGDLIMTKGDDGWYSVEVPQGYPNLLINANGGTVQTEDVAGALSDKPIYLDCVTDTSAKPVPVVHNEKVEIAEPEPTEPVAPTRPLYPPTDVDTGDKDDTAAKGGDGNTILLCIIGSVVIIAVAAVVIIILKKKKA